MSLFICQIYGLLYKMPVSSLSKMPNCCIITDSYLQIPSSLARLAVNGLAVVRSGKTTLARQLFGGWTGAILFLRFLIGTKINDG